MKEIIYGFRKNFCHKPTCKTLNNTAGAVFSKTSAVIPFAAALLLYQGKLIEQLDSYIGAAVVWQFYGLFGQFCLVYGLSLIMLSYVLFEKDRPKHIVLANDEAAYVRNELDAINKDQSNIDNYRASMKEHILKDYPGLKDADLLSQSKLEKAGIKEAAKLLKILIKDQERSSSMLSNLPPLTAGHLYDYYTSIIHANPRARWRINSIYKSGVYIASISLLLPFMILPYVAAYFLTKSYF